MSGERRREKSRTVQANSPETPATARTPSAHRAGAVSS